MITFLAFLISWTLMGLLGYLLWLNNVRLEKLSDLHYGLAKKVKDGEDVIIENFGIVEKHFKKLENEIEKTQRGDPKAKEALKAVRRIERARPTE